MMGKIGEIYRLPMVRVKPETRAKLEKIASQAGLLVPAVQRERCSLDCSGRRSEFPLEWDSSHQPVLALLDWRVQALIAIGDAGGAETGFDPSAAIPPVDYVDAADGVRHLIAVVHQESGGVSATTSGSGLCDPLLQWKADPISGELPGWLPRSRRRARTRPRKSRPLTRWRTKELVRPPMARKGTNSAAARHVVHGRASGQAKNRQREKHLVCEYSPATVERRTSRAMMLISESKRCRLPSRRCR